MISRTKYLVDDETVRRLFQDAGLGAAEAVTPLGAGEFNAVYSVRVGGKEYALKIAPAPDCPVLRYETSMMRAEVYWYEQIREHTKIRVPEVYFTDFSRTKLPANYFIMEKLDGVPMDKMEFSKAERADADRETAVLAAQVHGIAGEQFGYVQNELYPDWYTAIRAMTKNLLDDCARVNKRSRRGEKLLALIDRHKAVLEKAPCTMVNFDLCPPNILCRREKDGIHYAWIDPERSFWGDKILDFVCLDATHPLEKKTGVLAAYNAAAKTPVTATREEQIRYAVGQGYLALIVEAEKYYRYTPHHFGWWRNVTAALYLYADAFRVLRK